MVLAMILLRAGIVEYSIEFPTENSIYENFSTIAFANDFILAIRNETVRAVESISNIEIGKIASRS